MSDSEKENALARVEMQTGITSDQQLQAIKDGMDYIKSMTNKVTDLISKQEDTKQLLIKAELEDNNSRREYNIKMQLLELMEKVLSAHFAERKEQINGGFRIIDKALVEGNWDAVTKVYADMSSMVAKSPLAAAVEINTKMKSGKAITLDDFI